MEQIRSQNNSHVYELPHTKRVDNWNERHPVKLAVSMEDHEVVMLLNPETVLLYVSLPLNPVHSFQVTLHARGNAYEKGPVRTPNCISSTPLAVVEMVVHVTVTQVTAALLRSYMVL